MSQEKKAARLKVHGRVQGVFYRQSTRDKARLLGLSGWVRNEMDGTVVIEAAGTAEQLENLILWCHQGPPSAKVSKVDVEWTSPEEQLEGFDIR